MKYKATVVLVLLMIIFSGCTKRSEATAVILDESIKKEAVVVARPQVAVEEIYKSLKEYKAEALNGKLLREQLEIGKSDIIEYYGKISDPNEGLADVAIILPKETSRENVQLALSKYKERRIAEFENYDILDSYSIAQGAVIYDQGDYVIMLMLADNDASRTIIDEYIPQ